MGEGPDGPHEMKGRALVVFSGQADFKALRFLKKGFRHCFALLPRGGGWVLYNPLSHQTDIVVHGAVTVDALAKWYRKQGYRAVQCLEKKAPPRLAPLRPYTCVEAVKRVLGIHNGRILTPWQLYRHLRAQQEPFDGHGPGAMIRLVMNKQSNKAQGNAATACFSVYAASDPSTLPRVLGVFAKRGLVPSLVYASILGSMNEDFQIDLQMDGIAPDVTERLAEDLRQLVGVVAVLTSEKHAALTA